MNRNWLIYGMGVLLMLASLLIGCTCPGGYPGGRSQGPAAGSGMVAPGVGGSGSSYAPPTYAPPTYAPQSTPNSMPRGSGMR